MSKLSRGLYMQLALEDDLSTASAGTLGAQIEDFRCGKSESNPVIPRTLCFT